MNARLQLHLALRPTKLYGPNRSPCFGSPLFLNYVLKAEAKSVISVTAHLISIGEIRR